MFATGRPIANIINGRPIPDDKLLEFSAGVPSNFPTPGSDVARGVPIIPSVKFRVQVFDESGQRYFDVDCIGTRTFNLYGWGVTVFVLVKENGYEVSDSLEPEQLTGVLLEQAVVGSRVLPIRTNFTENPQNRTVSVLVADRIKVPIPPGAKEVQVFSTNGPASFANSEIVFAVEDPINPALSPTIVGRTGFIENIPGTAYSAVHRIPNANLIEVRRQNPGLPPDGWSFVFMESP